MPIQAPGQQTMGGSQAEQLMSEDKQCKASGQWAEAIAKFEKAARIDPTNLEGTELFVQTLVESPPQNLIGKKAPCIYYARKIIGVLTVPAYGIGCLLLSGNGMTSISSMGSLNKYKYSKTVNVLTAKYVAEKSSTAFSEYIENYVEYVPKHAHGHYVHGLVLDLNGKLST